MNKYFLVVFIFLFNITIEAQISDFKNINFDKADKIAYSYKGTNLKKLPELAYNLTNSLLTDVEKFRAIYTWVSTNIESDYSSYRKNSIQRKKLQNDSLKLNDWNKKFNISVYKKLLKEKKTVCTGYAYLVKNLANLANINCEIINGYGRIDNLIDKELQLPNHSWNAVKLNNKWYLCDATWSSGTYNLNNYTFEFKYNDGYFLANPELFNKNHFPIDTNWLLNENLVFTDFLKAPLVYGNAFIYNVFPIEPSSMFLETEKNKEVVFTLRDLKKIDSKSISLQIVSGNTIQTIQPKVERIQDGIIEVTYSFNERGLYDIHIQVGTDIICTYVVKVKK